MRTIFLFRSLDDVSSLSQKRAKASGHKISNDIAATIKISRFWQSLVLVSCD